MYQFNSKNRDVVQAFAAGKPLKGGNMETDGHTLALFGNVIAFRPPKGYGVCVTLSGWNTVTTRKCLSLLPGVSVWTDKGKPYINGIPVEDNEVLTIRTEGYKRPNGPAGDIWLLGRVYVPSDGWRGRDEPVYAVVGAIDTGMRSDSPCPSSVRRVEVEHVVRTLSSAGIPTKVTTGQTGNVFCTAYYVVVKPKDVQRAAELVAPLIEPATLLYPVWGSK